MSQGDSQQSGFPGAMQLFRVIGISVYLHWSWALVAVLVIQTRTSIYESHIWNAAEYLTLFGIVLLHEFGHALACRSVGGTASRILLWPLGGIAYVNPPRRPGALLWSIAAGPLVNVILVPITVGLVIASSALVPDARDLRIYLEMVATLNAVLLVFNMLPIYPLDGGQIVHALLWFFIGPHRSLRVAAIIGLIGSGGAILLLLLWGESIWLTIMAGFAAMRSWQGLKQAQALAKAMNVPRHDWAKCPSCHEPPPVGSFWRCACGNGFDMFASGSQCPYCGAGSAITACPFCGTVSPIAGWVPNRTTTIPET
ncbi:MAG: site-2 protease family protein [Phycisphaerales bacterium]|nr:site-2 protease family protein [Phycisphaerales bacterium]